MRRQMNIKTKTKTDRTPLTIELLASLDALQGTPGHLRIALVFHWLYCRQHMGSPKSFKRFTGYTLGELWAPKIAQTLRWLLFRQHLGILKSL